MCGSGILPRSNGGAILGKSFVKKIGLKKQKTRRSTGTNFLLFSRGYRPGEPS